MLKTMLLTIALIAPAAHAATLFISNNGYLEGQPGMTVGWDFTITSTPLDIGPSLVVSALFEPWIIVTSADFVLDPGVFPVGVFTPLVTIPGTPVGPDTGHGEENPWIRSFNLALQQGLASYDINPFQSPGDLATGIIVLTYDVYLHSPNEPAFDPILDTYAVGQTMSAPASVLVIGETSAVPEPAAFQLAGLGIGMCIAAGLGKHRRRARR